MFWMISCVTSARVPSVVASLHRSSVPMSHVCSTTASTAGRRSTPTLVASTTNPLLRKVLIGPGPFPSAGVRVAGRGSARHLERVIRFAFTTAALLVACYHMMWFFLAGEF